MTTRKKHPHLGAAECARRTGLTVRALRVYERHGLIDPPRSGKGWRSYGPKELQRLNVIVTLKAFGLSLAQIGTLLAAKPPPLARILQMQLRACRARRDTAERALRLVQSALATIESGQSLSLDELCNLTRSMEMGNQHAIARELINETISPEEERAYMTWVSTRPSDEIKAMQEYGTAVRVVFSALQELRQRGVSPAAPEAQALAVQWNTVALRYGLRRFMTTLLEWNPSVAQKWLKAGEQSLSRSMSSDQGAPDEGLWPYFGAAQAASAWGQALTQIRDEAAQLVERKAEPICAAARALAGRLAKTCSDHGLGEPLTYACWAGAMQFRESSAVNSRMKAAWGFLANAVEAIAPGTASPSSR